MILVGSAAMAHKCVNTRTPKDVDLIGSLSEIHSWATLYKDKIDFMYPTSPWKFKCNLHNGLQVELEVADVNPSSQMLLDESHNFERISYRIPSLGAMLVHVPDVEYMYMTKRSHIYWPVHWQKNIRDLHFLKKNIGHLQVKHHQFYEARLAENEAKFGKRFTANLNQDNEEFFKKSARSLKRVFNHDDLHEIVKYYDRPIYEMLKTNKSKALMNKEMFEHADREVQLNAVREEAMVIALERYVITGKNTTTNGAYAKALQRICTNLTSGWFREFAIDNWEELQFPDVPYIEMFDTESLNGHDCTLPLL